MIPVMSALEFRRRVGLPEPVTREEAERAFAETIERQLPTARLAKNATVEVTISNEWNEDTVAAVVAQYSEAGWCVSSPITRLDGSNKSLVRMRAKP